MNVSLCTFYILLATILPEILQCQPPVATCLKLTSRNVEVTFPWGRRPDASKAELSQRCCQEGVQFLPWGGGGMIRSCCNQWILVYGWRLWSLLSDKLKQAFCSDCPTSPSLLKHRRRGTWTGDSYMCQSGFKGTFSLGLFHMFLTSSVLSVQPISLSPAEMLLVFGMQYVILF